MKEDFDAIFVGAGHNALACALHLSAQGWRVGVFERAAQPGGAVRTGEFTLPGFRHDFAAMNLSLFAGSEFFQDYQEELGRHGLDFVAVDRPFASVFEDGSWLGITTDKDANCAQIAGVSEADGRAWQDLSKNFLSDADYIFGLLRSPAKISAFASFFWKLFRKAGLRGGYRKLRFLTRSTRGWLDRTFESPKVKALFGAWGMHLDFAPHIPGGAVFPYLEGQAGQAFGMVLGRGGADTIIKAMVAAVEARGGEVFCNAAVEKIHQENGRASGIELADGRIFKAGRAVIAGLAPRHLDRLTSGVERRMTRYRHAPGTMMIHLAMSGLPDWKAGRELQRFAYVHIGPSLDDMSRTYDEASAGLLPSEPILVVGQPTVFDPDRAPDGKHVLWLQVRMVPGMIRGDAAGQIDATSWAEAAEPMAERVFDILDRHAPGIRDKIIARSIFTPEMLEAENPNLVGGDQICGSHHLSQNFLFRPAFGAADGTTTIRNLYLTGAAVWPGAGTGAGSGYLLARKLAA
ncbi:phytoene desaturase family protein [Aestuariispira ectoiniformans]|uniref:phytoene desaturase family protein n=1 Tax=Aestuariispira ectoiniformans TaxID=2775080 RepID=UPI00223B1DAC|nr:NAD(P)/FAD-dependent oxidoreductase [Aestuariispira ectoiniformans]